MPLIKNIKSSQSSLLPLCNPYSMIYPLMFLLLLLICELKGELWLIYSVGLSQKRGGGVTGYLLKEGMNESANEQIIKAAYSSPTFLYKIPLYWAVYKPRLEAPAANYLESNGTGFIYLQSIKRSSFKNPLRCLRRGNSIIIRASAMNFTISSLRKHEILYQHR